jgi:hypothetical protein
MTNRHADETKAIGELMRLKIVPFCPEVAFRPRA